MYKPPTWRKMILLRYHIPLRVKHILNQETKCARAVSWSWKTGKFKKNLRGPSQGVYDAIWKHIFMWKIFFTSDHGSKKKTEKKIVLSGGNVALDRGRWGNIFFWVGNRKKLERATASLHLYDVKGDQIVIWKTFLQANGASPKPGQILRGQRKNF